MRIFSLSEACCNALCLPLFRHVHSDLDTDTDTSRKKSAIVLGSVGCVISCLSVVGMPYDTIYKFVTIALLFTSSASLLAAVMLSKKATPVMLEAATYVWTLVTMFSMYITTRRGTPTFWSAMIIFLDMCLVNQLPHRVASNVIALALTLTVANQVAIALDLSLPDTSPVEHICDCGDPPCRTPLSNSTIYVVLDALMLLVDFHLTRGFAMRVQADKEVMKVAVDTAEHVSVCLGSFDLDSATELLHGEDARTLPKGLTEALCQLLENLQTYRPFLPKSCLPMDDLLFPDAQRGTDAESLESQEATLSHKSSSRELAPKPSLLHTTPLLPLEMVVKRCTLCVINMHNSIQRAESDPEQLCSSFGSLLEMGIQSVEAARGLLDLFLGDRVHASFNATRMCGQHAKGAVIAVKNILLAGPDVNCGIATGKVHCGAMGCAEMRRFNFIGLTPLLASALERAGRGLGCAVVCSSVTQSDVRFDHHLRLIPRYLTLKKHVRGEEVPVMGKSPIYEVLIAPCEAKNADTGPDTRQEWMYALSESVAASANYDTAVRQYLEGTAPDDIQARLGAENDPVAVEAFRKAVAAIGSLTPMCVYV